MEGWIKLYRKFIDWEWFEDSEMVHLFLYLLLKANHKNDTWRGIEIKRGTLITGRKRLSEATKIPEQTIRTCIKRLKQTNEITTTTDPTKQYTIITICNYDSYQEENNLTNQPINQPTNQQSTNNQPATNQQLTTNKNVKNIKNEKNYIDISNDISGKKAKKFIIPTIEEVANYCAERNNGIDAETFWNFYNSKNWMIGKNKMKSWTSAVITWERTNKKTQPASQPQQPQRPSIRAARAARALGKEI